MNSITVALSNAYSPWLAYMLIVSVAVTAWAWYPWMRDKLTGHVAEWRALIVEARER